jgi:uncharacterized membrane protein YkvA (DUF1232 family)
MLAVRHARVANNLRRTTPRFLGSALPQVFATLVIIYGLSSIDLVPDFIPLFGLISDIVVLPLGLWCASLMIPEGVKNDARSSASNDESKPLDLFGVLFTFFLIVTLISWFSHLLYHILGPK